MTNELIKVELTNNTGFPRRYVVASHTAIAKGSLLELHDARAASGAVAASVMSPCAGVASMDKESDDYSTSISAWTDGIFKAVASGSIEIGVPVAIGGSLNQVSAASAHNLASGAMIIGYSLETATEDETFQFRLRL